MPCSKCSKSAQIAKSVSGHGQLHPAPTQKVLSVNPMTNMIPDFNTNWLRRTVFQRTKRQHPLVPSLELCEFSRKFWLGIFSSLITLQNHITANESLLFPASQTVWTLQQWEKSGSLSLLTKERNIMCLTTNQGYRCARVTTWENIC